MNIIALRLFKTSLIIIVGLFTLAGAAAYNSAVANIAAHEQGFEKSAPIEIDVEGERAAEGGFVSVKDEYARVELAYMRVVKYYNRNLTDGQALEIARYILLYSAKFQIDPRLVVAVIAVESRFQPRAVSPKGAQGLGQLMPGTASMLGVRNSFDVRENIYGTTRYLRMQSSRWQKNDRTLELALASYNAGPNAVEKYKGIPPYRETQQYVRKVTRLYKYFVYGS